MELLSNRLKSFLCILLGFSLFACGSVPQTQLSGAQGASSSGQGGLPSNSTAVQFRITSPVTIANPSFLTSLGQFEVNGSGQGTCAIFVGGRQLGMVQDGSGKVVLLGFLGPGDNNLSARSTAEVLLFFRLGGASLPANLQTFLLDQLKVRPEVQPFADVIAQQMQGNSTVITDGSTALHDAMEAAVASLQNLAIPALGKISVVEPPSTSGLRILQDSSGAGNRITVENQKRRRWHAYITQTGYNPKLPNSDAPGPTVEVSPAQDLTDFDLSPTQGITSLLGSVVPAVIDFISSLIWHSPAKLPFEPTSSEPVDLPITDGRGHTEDIAAARYLVRVVGPRSPLGPPSPVPALTEGQESEMRLLGDLTCWADMVFPVVISICVPAEDPATSLTTRSLVEELVKNKSNFFTDVANAVPGIAEAVVNGDFKGAVTSFWNSIKGSSGLKTAVSRLAIQVASGWLTSINSSNTAGFVAGATGFLEKALRVNSIIDAVLSGGDVLIQGYDAATSEPVVDFVVRAENTPVSITPEDASVWNGKADGLELTAKIDDNIQDPLIYHWTCTGNFGTLRSNVEDGNDLVTNSTVRYIPTAGQNGTDTVTVEVLLAGPRTPIGTAHTTVKTQPLKVKIEPGSARLNRGDSRTFQCVLPDNQLPDGFRFVLRWTIGGRFGRLGDGTTSKRGVVSSFEFDDTVTYQLFSAAPGTEKLHLSVFLQNLSDSQQPNIPVSEDDATILCNEDVSVAITPTNVELKKRQTQTFRVTPNDKDLRFRWTNTGRSGTLLLPADAQGTAASFVTSSPQVSYSVGNTAGNDTVRVEALAAGATGPELVSVGSSSANVSVTVDSPDIIYGQIYGDSFYREDQGFYEYHSGAGWIIPVLDDPDIIRYDCHVFNWPEGELRFSFTPDSPIFTVPASIGNNRPAVGETTIYIPNDPDGLFAPGARYFQKGWAGISGFGPIPQDSDHKGVSPDGFFYRVSPSTCEVRVIRR